MEKKANALITESSPYLLQHAYNPVEWLPWSKNAFERAEKENKLVLVSVGYSACHWCHVMEHECFEDEEVAAFMNAHFINIKVDREERPDVDQVYMTAVQLMTQKGGWPLNCFTLPDGRPVYGGTYFPKNQWLHVIRSLVHMHTTNVEKVLEYAENLHEGIVQSELIDKPQEGIPMEEEKLHEMVARWSKSFDMNQGGTSKAPKFPLPNNYAFLMHYGHRYDHERVIDFVKLTLDKMAMGGLYDQVGGGFARYSVDMLWKVPHFEKMLYDNAQLLSLYAKAYAKFKTPAYKQVVYQTVHWLHREMENKEGSYYSALDADSEGEEGKFYCWSEADFKRATDDDFPWAIKYYPFNKLSYWEDGKYILMRQHGDELFANQRGITLDAHWEQVQALNDRLLNERKDRVRPGLDDKCLTAWNGLLISGFVDAYKAFGDDQFKVDAIRIAKWIKNHQLRDGGRLWRKRKASVSSIDAFLDDYACVLEGLIQLYQITFDPQWMEMAESIMQYTRTHFQDTSTKMFYFTQDNGELIARKMELNDNVIPSSNAMMAMNLFQMGTLCSNVEWKSDARQMLANMYDGMEMFGSGYSHWGQLLLLMTGDHFEVVFSKMVNESTISTLQGDYLPHVVFAGGNADLPVLSGKVQQSEPLIFVCTEGTCLSPTSSLESVRKQLINN